jgi:hypothetical protein
MKPVASIPAIVCVAVCASAAVQPLTPEQIDKAIQAGQKGTHKQLIATCQAVIGFGEAFKGEKAGLQFSGSYEINLSQTDGQIALLSAAARRFYKPFIAAQVPEELKTVAVFMTAEPSEPYVSSTTRGSISVAAPIELMVIKAWPNRKLFVKPIQFKTEAVEWPNIAGQTLRGNRARAKFEIGQIMELTAGEIEVAVVTQAGERSCILPARDRKRVFSR